MSYRRVDKDPIMDVLRTIMQDSGWSLEKIAEESGLTKSTLWNWFYGETKRPQHLSVKMFLAGFGLEMRITPKHIVTSGVSVDTAQKEIKQEIHTILQKVGFHMEV